MNLCEALLDILAGYGVKYIYGIPGDAINELLEAVRKQDKIKFIHVMHEEAAAFAASAQAKLSGELCVCAGTAGPGAIHLLNGLYDAKADGAPVLAITGQVETKYLGTAYQQEVDLHTLFGDVTVYNQTVLNAEQFPEMAVLACQTALTRRGVSHLSIPFDISTQKVPDYKDQSQVIRPQPRSVPRAADLQAAAALMQQAEKPCILAGIGAREAVPELLAVAEKLQAPIVKALRGKDLLPDDHPHTVGGNGLLGTEPGYWAMTHCDLLLVVGSDFPYRDFYPDADVPMIQIDVNGAVIGRRHPVAVALAGDAAETLNALLPLFTHETGGEFLKESRERMADWLKKQDEIEKSRDTPIRPQALARAVSDAAADNAVIICDTGAVTVWGARNFRLKGTQQFTLSGKLASMAYGLPGAIGAQLYAPDRQVIALCGDGGFAMLMCDFATAVRYGLGIKVVVFNNGKLGLIQMEQESNAGNPEYQTGLYDIDYAAFARACGGTGYTISQPGELDTLLPQALREAGPCIIDVQIVPDELTMPPTITAAQALNFVKAKVTEFLGG